MPDSPETKVLKDINRQLSEANKGGLKDTLSPSETAALNKNVTGIVGNFEQMLDSRLKNVVVTTDRSFNKTFGNLQGFQAEQNDEQIAALDEIADDIEFSNKIMDKQLQNEFLKESEREDDLKINMKTNDILEDILEKEDDGDVDDAGGGAFSSLKGFLGGIFGGAGAGALLKGGLAFLGKAALAAGLVGLVAFGATSFLEGWKEAGEDASFATKLKSALGKTLDTLTLGLFGEDFFDNIMDQIHNSINDAIAGLQKIWDDSTLGFGEKFDKTLATLSFGLFGEEDIAGLRATTNSILEGLNRGINGLIKDATGFDLNEAVQEFYAGIDQLIEDTVQLFTDPVGLIIRKMKESKEFAKKEQEEADKRAEEGDISQLDDDELLEKLVSGTLTEAEQAEFNKRAKRRGEETAATRKGFVDFFKNIFDYSKEGVDRIQDAGDREDRIKQGQANMKALKDKKLADQTDALQREALEKQKRIDEASRKPEADTGLFGPRNLVNSQNINQVQREDTSTQSDDRSLQLQKQN